MLEIMKASAGSGKTYRLARKYITLMLESVDRYAYRHVLAVTFTNKATDEMKGLPSSAASTGTSTIASP